MAADFAIRAQTQKDRLNAAGNNFDQVMEVTFEVTGGAANGTVAQVYIPAQSYTPELVGKLVQERVDTLNAVAAL